MERVVQRGRKGKRLSKVKGRALVDVEAREIDSRVDRIRVMNPLGLVFVGEM